MARTFDARFDSECDECGCEIYEGDEVGWLDGTVVHAVHLEEQ